MKQDKRVIPEKLSKARMFYKFCYTTNFEKSNKNTWLFRWSDGECPRNIFEAEGAADLSIEAAAAVSGLPDDISKAPQQEMPLGEAGKV